ncbi:hypothetical protein MMC08_004477 [Hypocenomyce scalaris]|nr:hypothetical protein [Hypocenomyce scalaris]
MSDIKSIKSDRDIRRRRCQSRRGDPLSIQASGGEGKNVIKMSAGALMIGELRPAKDVHVCSEYRLTKILKGTEHLMQGDYLDNRFTALLLIEQDAPGAPMKQKMLAPPQSAFTFICSKPSSGSSTTKATSNPIFTKPNTAITAPRKYLPVFRRSVKRSGTAASAKASSAGLTKPQVDCATNAPTNIKFLLSGPFSTASATSSIELSANLISTLPNSITSIATADPAKCWPIDCLTEPMAPATKDRKSRFFPTSGLDSAKSIKTMIVNNSALGLAQEVSSAAGAWKVVPSKISTTKRSAPPPSLVLGSLPKLAHLIERGNNNEDFYSPPAARVLTPMIRYKSEGDMSHLRIKTPGFVGWMGFSYEIEAAKGERDASVTKNEDVTAVKGVCQAVEKDGKCVAGVKDEGYVSTNSETEAEMGGDWEGMERGYWV